MKMSLPPGMALLTRYQNRHQLCVLVAATLMRFDRRLDRLSRKSACSLAQELEGGLVKPREARPPWKSALDSASMRCNHAANVVACANVCTA